MKFNLFLFVAFSLQIYVFVESTFTVLLPKNGGMWVGSTTATITYIDLTVSYSLIGTVTAPDTTIKSQSTIGNSTSTTDNHGFVYLLTTSKSVTVDSCLLYYYLSISLKLSPSVTSQSNYPTNAFNPNPTNAFKPSSSQSNTPAKMPGSNTPY
ncbi:29382_t:CDS:2 [Racocetra persica]|uniref:29382_t:CDS:1 n=1 Tax=Racocetra persica TaxID=160502 RepID=A0ACA9KY62_9GLOM|nr:29382_t:CDS:2 [Racocetra persica]